MIQGLLVGVYAQRCHRDILLRGPPSVTCTGSALVAHCYSGHSDRATSPHPDQTTSPKPLTPARRHPALPHFAAGEWHWLRGALSTVDRSYGFLDHFFHHIADTHVRRPLRPLLAP